MQQKKLLQECLDSSLRILGLDWLKIQQIIPEIRNRYLSEWSIVVADPAHRPSPERVARAIASHLLDAGYSDTFLHRWWTYHIRHEPAQKSLADLIANAHALVQSQPAQFEVLVPLSKIPSPPTGMPDSWKNATEVSEWLRLNGTPPHDLRQVGGFLLHVEARDHFSAVERAAELLERLSARVHLATQSQLKTEGSAWIRGKSERFGLGLRSRAVEVGAIARENKLYLDSPAQSVDVLVDTSTPGIDAALELLASFRDGPPGPAVAGGWAAVEALLVGPGDGGQRSIACDRLASLVACSLPRAELTALAYGHSANASDALATRLKACATNRQRASLVAQAITENKQLTLLTESDRLAERRLKKLLTEPKPALDDVEQYVAISLHRMYRQRNLVLHWGRTDAVCLRATLRTAAPLIGAGVDRIAHSWFKYGTSPLQLCARAAIRRLELENPTRASPIDLLEPM